ncbi:MAG: hypothetical protein ACK5TQ_04395, partial [Acetobacteraceae bacterium]
WWRDALNAPMGPAPAFSRRALLAACLAATAPQAFAQNAAQPFALADLPGPLRPLGGLVIDMQAFGGGGFSAAHLAPDMTLTLISDRGHWAEARLLLEGLTPIGLAPLRHGPLRDEAGRPLPRGVAAGDANELELLDAFLRRGPRSVLSWCSEGHLAPRTNLLIVVDQFEELFRFGDYAGREEAEAFVSLLLESVSGRDLPIYVVLTMRSEFLGACSLVPGLAERINQGLYLTPRMTREETREAIIGPAAVCGFDIEPALVNRLLNDLAAFAPWEDDQASDQLRMLSRRADQLPLMQHVLNRLWLRARESAGSSRITLRMAEYELLGGLGGAIDAHAAEVVAALPT